MSSSGERSGASGSGTDREPARSHTTIPADVTFRVLEDSAVPGIKRSVVIELNKKVDSGVLRVIAMRVKHSDRRPFDRTFILYYLPNRQVGEAAWATTHFNPELDVRIIGATDEQEQVLKQKVAQAGKDDVVGHWFDASPGIENRISIFRSGDQVKMEKTWRDGSVSEFEATESSGVAGRTFRIVKPQGIRDYYVITGDGDLQIWDNDGLIVTAARIQ